MPEIHPGIPERVASVITRTVLTVSPASCTRRIRGCGAQCKKWASRVRLANLTDECVRYYRNLVLQVFFCIKFPVCLIEPA